MSEISHADQPILVAADREHDCQTMLLAEDGLRQ